MKDFVKKASQKISKLSDEQLGQLIEDLNEENSTYDAILESLSTGLIILTSDWKILQINKAAERLLPFYMRPSEKEAEEVWSYIAVEDIAVFLKTCAQEQKSNVSEEFSFQVSEKTHFVTISILPLVTKKRGDKSIQTKIVGSIITIEDNTEKRQQEILLHRMESLASLTNLAASVAHEIKNPLGAISIHIQLLQKAVKKSREGNGKLPQKKFMEDYLAVINEEIDNLNKVILDFLFAVRPVQATMGLCNVDSLIEKTANFFLPEFESKSVSLTLHLCHTESRLLIDEKLFRDVIINILQNSLSAIETRYPPRKIKENEKPNVCHGLTCGSLVIESGVKNERYILTIADNGCGMDEETLKRIFEPYYTTKANGTGLGMTMCYKIIKEFQGDIDVQSVLGHGTVFTIQLPIPQKDKKLLVSKLSEDKTQ